MVTDCPARLGSVTTETIILSTTVCPVTEESPVVNTAGGVKVVIPTGGVFSSKEFSSSGGAQPSKEAAPSNGAVPSQNVTLASGASTSSTILFTTMSSTTTLYRTVVMIKSTATVAPYPSGPDSKKPYGTGIPSAGLPKPSSGLPKSSSPSLSLVIEKLSTTSAASGKTATSTPVEFTGAASSSRGGMRVTVAVVIGAVAFLL